MKKLIYGSLLVGLVTNGTASCKKDAALSENSLTSSLDAQLKSSTLYEVGNAMLIFNTVNDFDKLIELSTDADNQILRDLSYISYTESLTSSQVNVIEDDFLSAALNKDQAIQIQNFIYRLNKLGGKVFALPVDKSSHYADLIAENVANPYVLAFSTEENVFELLGEVVDNEAKSISNDCRSTTQANNGGWTEYADYVDIDDVYGNGSTKRYKFSVWLRVRYDNWGFYRRLFTEFKHKKEALGGTFNGTYTSIGYGVVYQVRNGNSGNVAHTPTYAFTGSYTGTSNYEFFTDNKEIVHYKGTKCLKMFLKSWTWFRDRRLLTPRLYPNNGCLRIEEGSAPNNTYEC